MQNRRMLLVVLAALLIAAGLVWRMGTPDDHGKRADGDDYDYAAAFESLDPESRAPLFRIADIAGRSEAEVAATLGPPWDCESSLYSRRCHYAPGATEIVYIDGRADWLTVRALGDAALADDLLERIGLEPKPAGEGSDRVRVWRTLGGLREVSAHGHAGRADYLRIKVRS